jgi:hypothetical protein
MFFIEVYSFVLVLVAVVFCLWYRIAVFSQSISVEFIHLTVFLLSVTFWQYYTPQGSDGSSSTGYLHAEVSVPSSQESLTSI